MSMSLLFDFATKNLHLATSFYHLVAKWRLNVFFNFEPSIVNCALFIRCLLALKDDYYAN